MFLSNKTHLSKWTKMLKTNGELKETTLKHTGKKKNAYSWVSNSSEK